MVNIIFNNPEYLWFLLILPIFFVLHMLTLKFKKTRALKFANFEALSKVAPEYLFGSPYIGMLRSSHILIIFIRLLTFLSLIFAVTGTILAYNGLASDFDYVIAVDTSSSMIIDDFLPNRLEAAKTSALSFIDGLTGNPKVGLVSFSGINRVNLQLNEDLELVKLALARFNISRVGGTDIGGAIIVSSNLLGSSDKEKSVILITDGQSNIGTDVNDAISYAKQNDIMIHTIGLATDKGGSFGDLSDIKLTLDEETLKTIANATEGKYLRATSTEQLAKDITSLSTASYKTIKKDLSIYFIFGTLLLLFIEWSLVNVKYRTIP